MTNFFLTLKIAYLIENVVNGFIRNYQKANRSKYLFYASLEKCVQCLCEISKFIGLKDVKIL